MARLPAPEDYGLTTPRATGSPTGHSALRATPDTATGKALLGIGAMLQEEADKLDETVALDALNQLQNKQLDLTYGDDGFTKLQGKAVIDRKITDEYPTNLQKEIERLQGTIGSTAAKTKFQERAAGLLRQFKVGVYTHAGKETEAFHQNTENATISTRGRAANLAAREGNVEAVAGELSAARAAVDAAIQRRGLTGPQAEDAKVKALGQVHSDILNGLLDGGQSAMASAWLKTSRKEMTVDQADKFDARVKSEAAWAEGDTFVREQMATGKTVAEIEAALAADAKKTGDKTKYDAGLHTLGTMSTLRTKTYAENADKAQDEINRGAPWGKVRAKYIDLMDPSAVAAFDQRAKAIAKEGAVKTDFGAYYELSVMPPEKFAKVDLRTYVDKLSDANLRSLADRQGKIINGDEKEIKDTVTLQTQLAIAHNELGFGSTAGGRKKKGQFDEFVVSSIRAEENTRGKKLTDDERDQIIKRAMIQRSNSLMQFGDTLYYEVAGTPESKDFVPQIPAADRAAILQVFIKKGKQPTEADIVNHYKKVNKIQ